MSQLLAVGFEPAWLNLAQPAAQHLGFCQRQPCMHGMQGAAIYLLGAAYACLLCRATGAHQVGRRGCLPSAWFRMGSTKFTPTRMSARCVAASVPLQHQAPARAQASEAAHHT